MNTATKFDLRERALLLLRGPVPETIITGDAHMAVDYRTQCRALRAVVRNGASLERVLLCVEGMRADAVRMGPPGMDPHGAARNGPYGNHGHNVNFAGVIA